MRNWAGLELSTHWIISSQPVQYRATDLMVIIFLRETIVVPPLLAVNWLGSLPFNQYLINPFLTLKTDSIAKLRKELRSLLLEIPSDKIKGIFIKLVHLWSSFTVHIDIEGKCGWIIGGAKGYVAPPPSKIIVGGWELPLLFLRLWVIMKRCMHLNLVCGLQTFCLQRKSNR